MLGSFEAIRPLGRSFQFLERTSAAGERIFEIVERRPAVLDPETAQRADRASTLLEFDDVTFGYGPSEPLALACVSLRLEPGSRIAVVGPSGAGKSTIANLAVRFWDPSSGVIRLGGVDLRDLAQTDLRREIAVVGQETRLFNTTLRGNLRLAKPDATDEELFEVLRQAHLDELVDRLPKKLDTWMGEEGMRFSGGERQRLAIARALLKNAPILILDEPTANLDPATEDEVLDSIFELFEGRSILLITHRLVHMEDVNEILVLDAGHVVERGTHLELKRGNGLYRRMLDVQDEVFAVA